MNTKYMKILLASLLFLNIAALTSCKDDEITPDTPTGPTGPISSDEIELARPNDFYNLDVPGDADWQVTYCPQWVGLMNMAGKAGEKLQIFVDENDNDLDRRDTIMATLNGNTTVRLPLRQHGLASEDENDNADMITKEQLQPTYGVGYCTNVLLVNDDPSMKYYVKNKSPFNLAKLLNAIKESEDADAAFSEPLHSSRYESVTGSSTGSIASQLGINAGIEVGIKAFKFSVEAGYSTNTSSSDKYMYAMQEIEHIVGSRYIRAGVMRELAKTHLNGDAIKNDTLFQSKFKTSLTTLLKDPTNTKAMATIINTYGTHIIVRGTLGGELKVSMQMKIDEKTDASCIHAALGLSSKVVNVNGSFDMSNQDEAIAGNTTLSLRSYGGDNVYSIAPGATFEQFQAAVKDSAKMENWVKSINDTISNNKASLALIDMEVMPIWDLMPTEVLRDALHKYVVSDYQKQVFADRDQEFKSDLYIVKGYDFTTDVPGAGSIYIPDIDLEIVAERAIIPELSEDELSTVIYSGPKDNVNRKRGFFVGSSTRKPCKFFRDKDGSITTEVFDRLMPTAIQELYVDVAGDITIATKSYDDMYEDCVFDNWKYDLTKLTKDCTIKSDITVTGTTNHCVHIADGVTLTLNGVTANNQIVCDGNANIVLMDGTQNFVTCGEGSKAALQVGPTGKTLTLSGKGELRAITGSSQYSAGIGGKNCGNIRIADGVITAEGKTGAGIGTSWGGSNGDITITGGTVTANGGNNCAGIGAGGFSTSGKIEITGGTVKATGNFCSCGIGGAYNAKCNDILISGGTITSHSGHYAASIGSGAKGSCGNITIKKTVTSVTVSKTSDTCDYIGNSADGTCGTVTIENGANVIQN